MQIGPVEIIILDKYGSVAEWLSHQTTDLMIVCSNPTLGTFGKVPENHTTGQPKPCEGNWVVSW